MCLDNGRLQDRRASTSRLMDNWGINDAAPGSEVISMKNLPIVFPSCKPTVILHLSDIHFDDSESEGISAPRRLALNSLLAFLAEEIPEDWLPKIICVTGDIAFSGKKNDYKHATKWLIELCQKLGIDITKRLIMCAGNHDLNREFKPAAIPEKSSDSDKSLAGTGAEVTAQFQDFSSFCLGLGVPPFLWGTTANYLVGQRLIDGINFIALNSAWWSRDGDEGKLWLGLPHIRTMEAAAQLSSEIAMSEDMVVALFHHPPEWLNPAERRAEAGRPNTVDYLAVRVDLMLSGHTHGEARKPNRIALGGFHFTSGATYGNERHLNVVRLIKVFEDTIEYRSCQYDPGRLDHNWQLIQPFDAPCYLPERTELPWQYCEILSPLPNDWATKLENRLARSGNVFQHATYGSIEVIQLGADLFQLRSNNLRLLDFVMRTLAMTGYKSFEWKLDGRLDMDALNQIACRRTGSTLFAHNSSEWTQGGVKTTYAWRAEFKFAPELNVVFSTIDPAPINPHKIGSYMQVSFQGSQGEMKSAHQRLTPRVLLRSALGDITARQSTALKEACFIAI